MDSEVEREFKSKVEVIRSKNLRNFLEIFYYAYLQPAGENNPLISKAASERMQDKPPRVFPGLRSIRNHLRNSKGAAQDYLRAVYIVREIFGATGGRQQSQLEPISRKEYEQLLSDLAPSFEQFSKLFLSIEHSISIQRTKKQTRDLLNKAAKQISDESCFFTSDQCAKIIEELADWFV